MEPRLAAFRSVRDKWDPRIGCAVPSRCGFSETSHECGDPGRHQRNGAGAGASVRGKRRSIVLLGREEADLERSAADLRVRGSEGSVVGVARCDLESRDTFVPALASAKQLLGRVDAVVVTAGLFGTQQQMEDDLDLTERILTVNFVSTVLFCEEARKLLLSKGGTLCVFGSVAGDRPRKPVVLYGASKRALRPT